MGTAEENKRFKRMVKCSDIDEYHALFPADIRKKLEQLRKIILQAAPGATETISYNMPAFKQIKTLVYYAAYKHHIGFYPTSAPIIAFSKELENFKTSKGAIQFPLDKPLPVSLVKKMIKYRVQAVAEKAKSKAGKQV